MKYQGMSERACILLGLVGAIGTIGAITLAYWMVNA
jgi:hypothetical protein